jgi:hypothetical protein
LVDATDVVRVLTEQSAGHLPGVGVLRRSTGPFGVAEPQAVVVALGGDLREQEDDLGHRLLPTGEHLGVADRRLERKGESGELDMADAVDRRGSGGGGGGAHG